MKDKPSCKYDSEKSVAEGVDAKVYNALLNKERKILSIIPVNVQSAVSNKIVKVNCLLDSG